MFRLADKHNKKRRKGFTLIECIVSIAIFVIMGTMFATFMVSSVRVVNLTLANDRDREALLEAIAAANSGVYDTEHGPVHVEAIGTDGKRINLTMELANANGAIQLDDKFVKFTGPNGTVYSIYLGASAMSVKYLVIANPNDNQKLLDAIAGKTTARIQVTFKDEKDYMFFDVDATESDDPNVKNAVFDIHNDDAGKPYYVKYLKPNGEKYLIYMYKEEVTNP